MNHHIQPQGLYGRHFPGGVGPFQEQNFFLDARLPKLAGLFQTGDAEAVHFRQGASHPGDAMSVGVRLDDGHDLAARGALPDPGQVVTQRGEVNDHPGRSGHRPEPGSYRPSSM